MCVLMCFLCVWEQISVMIFCLKIYFLASEKPKAGQNRFQTVTFFFLLFFFSMFLCHYFTYVPGGFGKVLLALILSGTSKTYVFEMKYTSVFSIRTPVKDAGIN